MMRLDLSAVVSGALWPHNTIFKNVGGMLPIDMPILRCPPGIAAMCVAHRERSSADVWTASLLRRCLPGTLFVRKLSADNRSAWALDSERGFKFRSFAGWRRKKKEKGVWWLVCGETTQEGALVVAPKDGTSWSLQKHVRGDR